MLNQSFPNEFTREDQNRRADCSVPLPVSVMMLCTSSQALSQAPHTHSCHISAHNNLGAVMTLSPFSTWGNWNSEMLHYFPQGQFTGKWQSQDSALGLSDPEPRLLTHCLVVRKEANINVICDSSWTPPVGPSIHTLLCPSFLQVGRLRVRNAE